jgi:hypothetical protein
MVRGSSRHIRFAGGVAALQQVLHLEFGGLQRSKTCNDCSSRRSPRSIFCTNASSSFIASSNWLTASGAALSVLFSSTRLGMMAPECCY